VYAVDAASPESPYEFVADVPICVPPRNILYPVTPTLSVEAVQLKLICVLDAGVAPNPEGALGAVVSGGACVVALAVFEYALKLLAASVARTR